MSSLCVVLSYISPTSGSAIMVLDLVLSSTVFAQTTIMAASYKGGVVLGADSRTSTGSYVANRVTNKITQLAEKVRNTRLIAIYRV